MNKQKSTEQTKKQQKTWIKIIKIVGIVNNKLYNGTEQLSMEYEYGYIYGGLFVLGYCDFIHTYARVHGIDKLLFLSRDGDILKQVYDRLYPDDATEYACWSRKAATILMAKYNR